MQNDNASSENYDEGNTDKTTDQKYDLSDNQNKKQENFQTSELH